MDRALRWYDYLTINSYWFALTTRSQVLSPLIVPLLVQRFVGESVKGAYVGRMRLWSLMVAVLMQALMGLLSDRSTLRWGRRRPFIAIGTFGEVVIFVLIGLVATMGGMRGYWALFGLYSLSMVASNAAHAATQGLIPDLVPQDKRGRASGIKVLLELPIPLIFSSFVVAKMVEAGNLWGALIALMAVMVVAMAITMFVPEVQRREPVRDGIGGVLVRLALMTGVLTAVILGAGVVASAALRALAPLRAFAPLSGGWIAALTVVGGVITMAGAVLVGVWASVAISLGAGLRARHSFVWWVVNRLAFLVGAINLSTFMVYFLQERFADLSAERAAGPAAQVMMFVGVFILLTAAPSGWLADRFGKRLLIAVAGAVAALGIAVILLVPAILAMYVGGSLIGAAMGLFYSANWALGTEIVPPKEAGRYLGLSNLAGAGAGAIGAYIGGPIGDQHGYVVLFTIYGVMFLLSILALVGVRESRD